MKILFVEKKPDQDSYNTIAKFANPEELPKSEYAKEPIITLNNRKWKIKQTMRANDNSYFRSEENSTRIGYFEKDFVIVNVEPLIQD